MPTYTQFTNAPLPTGSEAGNGPANLLAYATGTDDLHVLKATSVSDRDTKYANVTAGTLVSCAALGIVWQKTTTPPTAAAWRTLVEIGTPVTSGVLTANTVGGWSVTSQWAQRLNGVVIVSLGLSYVGDAVTVSASGGIADQTMGTIQSGFAASSASTEWVITARTGSRGGDVYLRTSDQTLQLASLYPGANLTSETFRISGSYPAA